MQRAISVAGQEIYVMLYFLNILETPMSEQSFLNSIFGTGNPLLILAGILFIVWFWSSKTYLKLYREQMKQLNDMLQIYHTNNQNILRELTSYIQEDHKIKMQMSETLSRLEVKVDNMKDRGMR